MTQSIAFRPPVLSLNEANAFTAQLRRDRSGFLRLAALLEELCGIHLPDSEKNLSLMAGRVGPILRERQIESYEKYAEILKLRSTADLQEFVSALTTNTTEFFRESAHFEHLAKMAVKEWRGRSEVRIWCAACSSGQEVWTILMTLYEAFQGAVMPQIKVLATDIDYEILSKASRGRYTEHEMNSVPPLFKQRYFQQLPSADQKNWQVNSQLAQNVTFAPFNLTTDVYPFKHPFDVVFCRNVLIYFDKPTVAKVLQHLSATLRAGGHLYLGHSESGTLRSESMVSTAAAVYKRTG